ncbi:MAG: type II toxin-antitoxin system VapC family toxin [Rhodospirillales bacterium]|jgi:hypothetical protein
MIILDTNVLSAVMRRDADPVVVAWLDRQPSESLWITTITVFEIRFGLELLPDSRKRKALEKAFAQALEEDFQRRILPFDFRAAEEAAMLAARRRNAGQTVEFRDTQIAGIALARQATLATRNVRHFQDVPVTIIDPSA